MKIILLCLLLLVPRADALNNIEEFTLPNGLRVVVIKKKTIPVVAFSIWYKCGAVCDQLSKSGTAHYLEHIAFSFDNKSFEQFLDRIGADKNAFTSWRYITFTECVPKNYLEDVFKYEAKRMQTFDIDPEVFQAEKGAILDEENSHSDSPRNRLDTILQNVLYNREECAIPIIGWRHEIEKLTQEDLFAYHKTWFAPNNATIVVAGNCDTKEIKHLAEKYFGHIPTKVIPKNNHITPVPTSTYHIKYHSKGFAPAAERQLIYHVPFRFTDTRKAAALILAMIALNSPTTFACKLLEHITQPSIELSISADLLHSDFSYLTVDISAPSICTLDNAKIVQDYICYRLRNIGITQIELDKAKKKTILSIAHLNDDISYRMHNVGVQILAGRSINDIKNYTATIKSITLKECNDILQEIFKNKPIVYAELLPKGIDRDD